MAAGVNHTESNPSAKGVDFDAKVNEKLRQLEVSDVDFDAKVKETMRQLEETRKSIEKTMESVSRQQAVQAAAKSDLQEARSSLETQMAIARARLDSATADLCADLGHSDLPTLLAGSSMAPFGNSSAGDFSSCMSALLGDKSLENQVDEAEKQEMLAMVISMGFSETRALRALAATGWTSVDAALDAAMLSDADNHGDQHELEIVEQLKSLGVEEHDARTALDATGWSGVEAAMSFLYPEAAQP